jgi:hypothetical protein
LQESDQYGAQYLNTSRDIWRDTGQVQTVIQIKVKVTGMFVLTRNFHSQQLPENSVRMTMEDVYWARNEILMNEFTQLHNQVPTLFIFDTALQLDGS